MVIDSHVLLWWLTDPGRLSVVAGDFLDACLKGKRGGTICAVSLWELEWKRRRGKLPLAGSVREWLPRLRKFNSVELSETSVEHWLLAAELVWEHGDPADRLIAAAALERGVAVLTKDGRFHAPDSPVEAVW